MSVHPSLPHRQAPSEGRSAVVMVAEPDRDASPPGWRLAAGAVPGNLRCRRLQTLPNSPAPKVLPFVAAWCRRAEKLTAANALRALGQVFLMREKAVASMSKFDFLISPTSPVTAYAVDEATPGNATGSRSFVTACRAQNRNALRGRPGLRLFASPDRGGISHRAGWRARRGNRAGW